MLLAGMVLMSMLSVLLLTQFTTALPDASQHLSCTYAVHLLCINRLQPACWLYAQLPRSAAMMLS